nr:ionotropic glutamate receptor-4 [Pleurobrachia bachei]|eukprot:sb/3461763/
MLTIICLLLFPTSASLRVAYLSSSNDPYYEANVRIAYLAANASQTDILHASYSSGSLMSLVHACCELVDAGVGVIVSDCVSAETATQADILSPLGMPMISVSATDPYLKTAARDKLITMSPSDSFQGEAVFDLLKHFDWQRLSILASSDSYGTNGLIKLQHLVTDDPILQIDHTLFFDTGGPTVNVKTQLLELKDSLAKVILLHCGSAYALQALNIANEIGLLGPSYVWILTEAISSMPSAIAVNGSYPSYYDGLLGIRTAMDHGRQFTEFKDSYLLSSRETSLEDITIYSMQVFDAVTTAAKAVRQLDEEVAPPQVSCDKEGKWGDGQTVYDTLVKQKHVGLVGDVAFTADGTNRRVKYEILNFRDDKFLTIGSWSNSTRKLNLSRAPRFLGGVNKPPSAFANNLIGRHLKLGALAEGPFMYEATEGCEGNKCWSGICHELVERLSQELKFTYEYVKPPDGHWGGEANGSWNGLIGELIQGNVDMVPLPLSTSSARKQVIDFSYPFMDAAITAMVKGESKTSNIWFFLKPFDSVVFLGMTLASVLVSLLVTLKEKISPYGKHGAKLQALKTCLCKSCDMWRYDTGPHVIRRPKSDSTGCLVDKVEDINTEETSLFNSLWMIDAGLVGKATRFLPFSLAGRFLLFTWWFFMLIMITVYTANLTAFMTLNNMGVQVTQVIDLLGQTKLRWGVIGNRNPQTLLMTNQNTIYSKIATEGETLTDLGEALGRLRGGSFVFIDEVPILAHHLKDDCDMLPIGSEFQSFEYSFGIPKGSPIKYLIDRHLLEYRETGMIDELWAKWSPVNAKCETKVGNEIILDMKMLAGAFYILGAGIVISIILLIGEVLYASILDVTKPPNPSFTEAIKRRLDLKREYLFAPKPGLRRQASMVHMTNSSNPRMSRMQSTSRPNSITIQGGGTLEHLIDSSFESPPSELLKHGL